MFKLHRKSPFKALCGQMKPITQISVIMVEDNPDMAFTIKEFLGSESQILLLGEAREEIGFQNLIAEHLPELALVDIGLSHSRAGLELLHWLRQEYPVIKPVIMTVNEGDVLEAYQLGARGYVLKSNLEILVQTLMEVSEGQLIIPPEVGALLVRQMADSTVLWKKILELAQLSEREKAILRMLKEGVTRDTIAARLNISFFTVRRHIQNILTKCDESNMHTVINKFSAALDASPGKI